MLDDNEILDQDSSNIDELLIILDDVHNIGNTGDHLLGALLQISETTKLKLMIISRASLTFYDRRDVHTRKRVKEINLSGLSLEELSEWLGLMDNSGSVPAEQIHRMTGGHPLAVELLEIYGETIHEDWLRFLDEEILNVMPDDHRELLSILAVSKKPIPWNTLARAAGVDGSPPKQLTERGLMIELDGGLWLHEALRSRLLREVGRPIKERVRKLNES